MKNNIEIVGENIYSGKKYSGKNKKIVKKRRDSEKNRDSGKQYRLWKNIHSGKNIYTVGKKTMIV